MKTKKIPLTREKFAIVDAKNFEWLAQWKWTYHSKGHAYRRRGKNDPPGPKTIRMHRLIVGLDGTATPLVDHKNRDRLDNREENLRVATNTQNLRNRGPQKNNTSGFKGVSRFGERWQAGIWVDGSRTALGLFDTPEDAAHAYDNAARKLFGEFAWLNFPEGR